MPAKYGDCLQRKALESLYSRLAKSDANRDLRTEIEWEKTIILVENDNKYFESLTTLQSLRKAYSIKNSLLGFVLDISVLDACLYSLVSTTRHVSGRDDCEQSFNRHQPCKSRILEVFPHGFRDCAYRSIFYSWSDRDY